MIIKNEKTFKEFALENYKNEHCISQSEFEADLKTIFLIKRLFKRFLLGDEINPMILVNLFITMKNVFPDDYAFEQILIYKIEDYYYGNLKSVLSFLNINMVSDELEETTMNIELKKLLMSIKYKYNK